MVFLLKLLKMHSLNSVKIRQTQIEGHSKRIPGQYSSNMSRSWKTKTLKICSILRETKQLHATCGPGLDSGPEKEH